MELNAQCEVLTDNGHTVQSEVLTVDLQNVNSEVLTDSGHMVEFDLLTFSGQPVHCKA